MLKNLNYANWLYFIGTKENPTQIFVYGLSVPTNCPIEYSLNMEDKGAIKAGTHLYLFRSVKRLDAVLVDNNINLEKIYSDDKHKLPCREILNIITKQHFIQKSESCPVKHGIQSPINSLVLNSLKENLIMSKLLKYCKDFQKIPIKIFMGFMHEELDVMKLWKPNHGPKNLVLFISNIIRTKNNIISLNKMIL